MITLEQVGRTDRRYLDIRARHYVEPNGCIGQQVHHLVVDDSEVIGIISGASAVYATRHRDNFFGITKDNRSLVLNGIVNNTVFRLEKHEPNLATQILAKWRTLIPSLWLEKYGVVVYGFETFVVEEEFRKGTLYKADNWTFVGRTSGASKRRNGIEKPADDWAQVAPKLVFCKWVRGFTEPMSMDYAPMKWRPTNRPRFFRQVLGQTGGVQ